MNHRSLNNLNTQAVWVCVILGLVLDMTTGSPAHRSPAFLTHHLTKRSFFDIQCKGVYDKSIFARLDRICEDCYNLFREPTIHSQCREDCFTSDIFEGCAKTLQFTEDELDEIKIWIKQLHGAPPGL